jgi:hypothetical protein
MNDRRAKSPGDKHSGAPITLTQWTLDGRYLIFSSNDLSGGILYALPLGGERNTKTRRHKEGRH